MTDAELGAILRRFLESGEYWNYRVGSKRGWLTLDGQIGITLEEAALIDSIEHDD